MGTELARPLLVWYVWRHRKLAECLLASRLVLTSYTRYVRKINENGLTARRSYPDHRQVGDLWLCPRYDSIFFWCVLYIHSSFLSVNVSRVPIAQDIFTCCSRYPQGDTSISRSWWPYRGSLEVHKETHDEDLQSTTSSSTWPALYLHLLLFYNVHNIIMSNPSVAAIAA